MSQYFAEFSAVVKIKVLWKIDFELNYKISFFFILHDAKIIDN